MATPKTVAFHTLGCKLNFSETSAIAKQMSDHGFLSVDFSSPADIYVLNTCSVTDFADRKCRKSVRDALKNNPNAKIVVIGCYAQLKPKEISEIPGVDLVLGAKEKFNLIHHIEAIGEVNDRAMIRATEISEVNTFIQAFSHEDRTRTFLKIQDGCDYKCTFCTIPLARGKSRSDKVENVLNNIKTIAESGKKEIVLTGVNIGDFGNGTEVIEGKRAKKEALFIDLIKEVDSVQPNVDRFRISSIEPNLCTEEIIDFVSESKRFLPHFHMPLQSGSAEVLKNMKRRYKKDLYKRRVEYIRSRLPHASIGVDVIVGFPGETEKHFNETVEFIKELEISYLHVFTYSERPNTLANQMEDIVPMEERRRRNGILRSLSEKKKRQFYNKFVGDERYVLVETAKQEGKMSGYTDNYIRVLLPYVHQKLNTLVKVRLLGINEDGIMNAEFVD